MSSSGGHRGPGGIEPGKVHSCHVSDDAALQYFLYVPKMIRRDMPHYVSVHGISRNAGEHAALFAPLAERYGVVLIAPVFSRRHFGDYQRLGRRGSGRRADRAIQRIGREVASLTGAGSGKLCLFGFSGGGQFAHRYSMAHPRHVERVVIGAAGWYTYPDETCKYPYGTAATPRLADIRFDMRRFLQVPACVLVGQWDIRHDAGLNRSARIQRQQGSTRLERGRRWVDAMNRAAMAHGADTPYQFSVLPGIGHDFTRAMQNGQLGQRVFSYLYGAPPAVPHRVAESAQAGTARSRSARRVATTAG
jgi:pimeloyl-ACP methyl ester carboxylesterase